MEQIIENFNNIFYKLNPTNKYFHALLSIIIILCAEVTIPRLPDYISKWLKYKIISVFIMFLLLFIVLRYEPSTALLIAVVVNIILFILDSYKKKENMAEIEKGNPEGVPKYVYSTCGSTKCPIDVADAYRGNHGEHGEKLIDGPISSVSDRELESLCVQRLKNVHGSENEILTSANFSELTNAPEVCTFAEHQYNIPQENVPCADSEKIENKDVEFTNLAPINM